ncbi:hypothetical protein N665_0270s0024, partial [Sinapis alba]
PYIQQCSFQNLLNSQQPNTQWNESVSESVPREPYQSVPCQPYQFVPREPYQSVSASDASVFSLQWNEDGNKDAKIVSDRKERRKWSLTEDVVLISAWLNTSKDPVVWNEQKTIAFWKRIVTYFAASPKLAALEKRGPVHCKARWGKINEGVCKFVGCYEAATKQRSSGQNKDDVLKMARAIYFNDYKKKYTLEHACHGEEAMARPVGVKAAKAKGKKSVSKNATLEEEEKETMEFWSIWDIRQVDFALKATLFNKQKLLDSLITKTEPLSKLEITLKTSLLMIC